MCEFMLIVINHRYLIKVFGLCLLPQYIRQYLVTWFSLDDDEASVDSMNYFVP